MKDILPHGYQGNYGAEPPEPPRRHENPIFTLHRHLRGRYGRAALLGLLLAVPLSIGGYFAVPPTYSSTAIVRIAPTINTVMYQSKDTDVPPLFESLVATQASLLSSRRVLDIAIENPDLKSAGWPEAPDGLALLQKNLEVSNRRAVELITATVKHRKPELAQKAVNAILSAYESVYDENNSMSFTQRQTTLSAEVRKLEAEIETKKAMVREYAKKYATDELDDLHSARIAELNGLNNDIDVLERELANRLDPAKAVTPEQVDAAKASQDTIPMLALESPTLAALLDDKRRIERHIEALSNRLGPDHRDMKEARRQLASVETQIANTAEEVRKLPRTNPAKTLNVASMTDQELQERITNYKATRDRRMTEANELQTTKLAIASLKEQMASQKETLDITKRTLEQSRFESQALTMGRVSVLQEGDYPIQPTTDRRIPLAAIGGMAGFGMGGAIMLGIGLIRGGYRYIDDVEREEGAAVPLLGTVPDLSDGGVEQEQMAALSVHHLRNMLQLQFDRVPGGKVYTITSSSAGDGKTSLSIALAMSFAATGRRTIIVDTDLVGRGLTRQLDLGGQSGLCEALRKDKLNGEVKEPKIHSLWALPSGNVTDFVPEHLSSYMIANLLRELREKYDAVILDTGPILGSLEANVVAPASDGVVLVVSRGQNGKTVRASIERLRRLGATCSGLIFNRAGSRDFRSSVSTTAVSARSIQATSVGRTASPGRAALIRALEVPSAEDAPKH